MPILHWSINAKKERVYGINKRLLTTKVIMATTSPLPRICVLGSLNIDLVSYVPHHPAPGETLTSNSFAVSPGGKVSYFTLPPSLTSSVTLLYAFPYISND